MVIDPTVIINSIPIGNAFLTNLVHNEILQAHVGEGKNSCDVDSECLLFILKGLQYRVDEDLFDEVTEKLYKDLILIIGGYVAPVTSRFYYGLKNTATAIDQNTILASNYISAVTGSNPIIPFDSSQPPKYGWMAEFIAEPTKTKWQDTVIVYNNGNIGSSGDLFKAPYTVTSFRVYETNYATQFQFPIQFKTS